MPPEFGATHLWKTFELSWPYRIWNDTLNSYTMRTGAGSNRIFSQCIGLVQTSIVRNWVATDFCNNSVQWLGGSKRADQGTAIVTE